MVSTSTQQPHFKPAPATNLALLPRLLADLVGTNARFAWRSALVLGTPHKVAIAHPIAGNQVRMTNHHWSFSQAALKTDFGFYPLRLLSDFTALVQGPPDLSAHELRQVGTVWRSLTLPWCQFVR